MKKGFRKQYVRHVLLASTLLMVILGFVSCKDDYYYDEREPSWLGASIYHYLKKEGNYTNFVQLIEDVGYTEVLTQTGSKTLFVANDEAFKRFFQNNNWGVTSYNGLSLSQKKLILNFAMVDNAYLIETFANYYDGTALILGQAIRRRTAVSVLDSLPREIGNTITGSNNLWGYYKANGIYLLKDNSSWPLVHFLQKPLTNAGISDTDFELITGKSRQPNDAHIFSNKIIERDITCKNGYIHVLEDVLIPPVNMAEYLRTNGNTTIFSKLLERFAAPYYDHQATVDYKKLHPEFNDSIFEKRYFAGRREGNVYYTIGSGTVTLPNGSLIDEQYWLPYSPGWNSYVRRIGATGALQSDMAAILAPTDQTMNAYFNTGAGSILKERFGSWDFVPNDIVILFLKRHLRESLLQSIPSRFNKMTDNENSVLTADKSHITGSYVGLNGVVYLTNSVYPPDDYVSVYGPVLFSSRTQILNWAIRKNDFRLYLNALESRYSFFVPTDEFFNSYIEPFAYGKNKQGALRFWFNKTTSNVNATVHAYNPATNEIGDSINVITNETFLVNRLLDLLDAHIVVGDVETGKRFYFTKGVNVMKVEGAGMNLKVQGGHDVKWNQSVNVTNVYNQVNGKTYFIDKPIQSPLQSVYKVLSTTPEFSEFFDLLNGFPAGSTSRVFINRIAPVYGIDANIKFFNTFRYTVYVPTNQKLAEAIAAGQLPVWESRDGIIGINQMTDAVEKANAIKKLERFLRYHFQDNSVFISGQSVDEVYQTATIKTDDLPTQFGTFRNKYYKVGVSGSGNNLVLSTENYGSANVITENGLFNIMTRDYIFNANPSAYKEIDGSGVGAEFSSSTITTSSTAVIHQIDNVLRFE